MRNATFASSRPCSGKAFSLLELLAVIAIIIVLMVAVLPVTSSILGGFNLTRASSTIADQLALARQTALAKNSLIEVRFYKAPDYVFGSEASKAFRGLEILQVTSYSGATTPLKRIQWLPSGVIISDKPAFTSLNTSDRSAAASGASARYDYFYLRFLPDGSTDLPPNSLCFLTLYEEKAAPSGNTPPANFATIQIDPVNGAIKTYRP